MSVRENDFRFGTEVYKFHYSVTKLRYNLKKSPPSVLSLSGVV